jgi:hypothetical protein
MHWTALGVGLGIAAYFGVSREPGAAVFLGSQPFCRPMCRYGGPTSQWDRAIPLIGIAVVACRVDFSLEPFFRAYPLAGAAVGVVGAWQLCMARYF